MRQTLVVGNWKMHGTRASVASLLGEVVGSMPAGGAEAAVCPSYVHLPQAVELCAGSDLAVGAQDCSHMQSGAYTGEVSAQMLVDQGCRWVILGHSERRQSSIGQKKRHKLGVGKKAVHPRILSTNGGK